MDANVLHCSSGVPFFLLRHTSDVLCFFLPRMEHISDIICYDVPNANKIHVLFTYMYVEYLRGTDM